MNPIKSFFHLKNYWFLVPFIGQIPWLGMLIAMLSAWNLQGRPLYWFAKPDQIPPYISYIGATNLRPLFISCAGAQGLFYEATLVIEFFLRRSGKLQYWFKKDERNLLFSAIILGAIGELGILFVAIFSIKKYDTVHHAMLGVFLAFICLSGICLITENCLMGLHYQKIHVSHKYWNKFTISFYLKLTYIVLAIVFAICFGGFQNNTISSIFEWTLAFWYITIFWILTWDLFPAAKHHHKNAQYIKNWENYDYYYYNQNPEIHPYEKYAGPGLIIPESHHETGPYSTQNYSNSNEGANTLVQSPGEDHLNTNREFTDEELRSYPQKNQNDSYPIPNGQQIPIYNQVNDNDNIDPYTQQKELNNNKEVQSAYENGTKDDKKNCIIV
ncbi:putative membrane protein [Wickerhamomyces ciferrii]|uniref:Membrane protein n=1 Tax=Wickerhamomyces ciferrii (strain ATCC 14091 / BCRC 22168 / CBS 111 / JCM 3599 / NBRC 0793 / NRRL Y-1031 F-60-10) TaxID=1206466 RepID=K0KLY2_WICCF|nr:uncharacterized protein BN7_1677 [Wickerhamomyces ciferrii]CCH42133.1 putative membrane protein [Wickerhamomyces ciferrii]